MAHSVSYAVIKQSSETSHFLFTGIELSGTSTVIFRLIYKYIFGIALKCRPTTSRLLLREVLRDVGRLLSSHRSPVRPTASFRLRVPHLLDVSGLNSVISSFLPLFFLSWSPENNAAVNGGERVFTHYMRVKSAHLGVVLVLIGLFPPCRAVSMLHFSVSSGSGCVHSRAFDL